MAERDRKADQGQAGAGRAACPPTPGRWRPCALALLLLLASGGSLRAEQPVATQPASAPVASPAAGPSALPDLPAPVWHIVLFQLRSDAPAEAAADLIADSKRSLAQIPGVLAVSAGRKAADARDVHVKDYDVAVSVRLAGRAALAGYATDPHHLELIARQRAHIAGWRVIDFFAE